MSIKGLTDRGLAFPEIGRVRKGAKKGENRPGADLTFFRVEFDELEVKAAADFKAAYKDKPTAIRIILPFNEIERMWDAWLEAYTTGRMIARSDGEFITYQLDDKSDLIVHNGLDKGRNKVPHPADGIAGRDYKGNVVRFKPTGRLKVMIPELARAAYLTVMTTSTHDIMNISSQLAAFKELNNGQLAGIPFILRRRPKSISTPSDNGQRVRRVKSLISIEVDPDWAKAKFGQLNALALPSGFESQPAPHGDFAENVIEVDEDEITDEFMQEPEPQAAPAEETAIELIAPHGDWAVKFAMKEWNTDTKHAAQDLWKKIPSDKPMDKRDLIAVVTGGPQPA
jgi:hypothetical protein